MVRKYTRLLEENAINSKTGNIWTINDVPATWRERTRNQVIEDGFAFDENGIAYHALKSE